MTDELQAARKEDLPYLQLANEISVAYPQIREIQMGQGAHVAIDSLKVAPCLMINVWTDTLMTGSSLDQFEKWIKVRLQADNVRIENACKQ